MSTVPVGSRPRREELKGPRTTARSTVLVVDDEAIVRETTAQILDLAGFDSVTAPDGAVAIELASQIGCDVAVIDLNMPGLSGLDTVRRLKKLSPDTEIIVLSGAPSLESSIETVRSQIFDYLCKPMDTHVLSKMVQRAAERRRGQLPNRA